MTISLKVQARPYRMSNHIQTYAWGTRGKDAYIPRLLGIEPQSDKPYAELWMGAHPKAPSQIHLSDGTTQPLDAWIAAHPAETLGRPTADTYGALPFLLKVLSAGQSLSIQAHPNKLQAAALHQQDPEHYPDSNHKPEIAIALDQLTALMGFKPYPAFVTALTRYPEISGFIGSALVKRLVHAADADKLIQATLVREVFAHLIQQAMDTPQLLAAAVDALAQRLQSGFEETDEAEQLLLDLRDRYGSEDPGLFALLLFNMVHLKAGDSIYIDAGVPHAYLKGNIVECMASSDNVVRVGLTPKYRDAKALLRIVDTTPRTPEILDGNPIPAEKGVTIATYTVPTPEFVVSKWSFSSAAEATVTERSTPDILLVVSGSIEILWDGGQDTYTQGQTAFLPACLSSYTVKSHASADVIIATVQE